MRLRRRKAAGAEEREHEFELEVQSDFYLVKRSLTLPETLM